MGKRPEWLGSVSLATQESGNIEIFLACTCGARRNLSTSSPARLVAHGRGPVELAIVRLRHYLFTAGLCHCRFRRTVHHLQGRSGRFGLPRPVATTVTLSSSVISGSITVPTTTVASSDANSSMVSPTSENSPRDRSRPAVMLTRIPRAPCRSISSSSGLLMARLGCFAGAIFALGIASAHHCHAHFRHHGAHVGEVHIDHSRANNQVSDALNSTQQYIVGLLEGIQQTAVLDPALPAISHWVW